MIALFYDTETTGLPLFNEPSEDPRLMDTESREWTDRTFAEVRTH